MSQKIFKFCLDTETISLYLLCCSLADTGETISVKNLKKIWNGPQEMLAEKLDTLIDRNIIRQVVASGSNVVYRLRDESCWQKS